MAERPAKVSFGFIHLNPIQKGAFGDTVITEMTTYVLVFPTPDIPLVDLTTANNDLKMKTQLAQSGDKLKILERDASEKAWNALFRKEAQYVERIASGDKVIIAKGGFQSTDTEVQPQPKPDQAVLSAWGNKVKGSVHAEIEPLANTKGLVFIASTTPSDQQSMSVQKNGQLRIVRETGSEMEVVLGTKRKVDFVGLVSGTKYYITALGFNAAGPGDMSLTVDVIAP
jgi:hypothetical protein